MDEEIDIALGEYVATVNADKYDSVTLRSKFPELKDYDDSVLGEYVATVNADKYDAEALKTKFPEFYGSKDLEPEAVKTVEPKKEKAGAIESGDLGSVSVEKDSLLASKSNNTEPDEPVERDLDLEARASTALQEGYAADGVMDYNISQQDIEKKALEIRDSDKKISEASEKINGTKKPKEKRSYLSNLFDNVKAGSTELGKMIASLPETVYDVASIPQNAFSAITGIDLEASSTKFKEEYDVSNPILDFYVEENKKINSKISEFNERYESTSIYENIKEGNITDAFQLLGSGIAQSAPISISMMVGGAAASTGKLLAGSTAAFTGSNRLGLEGEDSSELEKTIKALGLAGAETVFSTISSKSLGKVYKDIITKEGAETGANIFKDGLVTAYTQALKKYGAKAAILGEGIEEVATTMTQNLINGKPVYDNIEDSFIQGMGGGLLYGTPMEISRVRNKFKKSYKEREVNKLIESDTNDFNSISDAFKNKSKGVLSEDKLDIITKEGSYEMLESELSKEVELGEISEVEVAEIKQEFLDTQSASSKVSGLGFDKPKSVKAVNLIKRKDVLNAEIKNLDDALAVNKKQEVESINEQLNNLVNEKSENNENNENNENSKPKAKEESNDKEIKTEGKEGDVLGEGKKTGNKLFSEPNPETADIVKKYKESKGIKTDAGQNITELDIEQSKEIADAYDAMEDNPNDPEVKEAYTALADETLSQFEFMKGSGYEVEIYEGEGDPYSSSAEMIADLKENKHIYIFSTESGYGKDGISEQQREESPMLASTEYTDKTGKPLLVNDVFRAVHDFFGHSERGNSFGAKGEENAWDVHARMYGDKARRAMTTETRGQNSWVNFNKNVRNEDGTIKKKGDEGYLSAKEKPFADQKAGLLDEKYSQILTNDPESSISELSSVDLSTKLGINKAITIIDSLDKQLKDFGNETLGINLPVSVARVALKGMKVAAQTSKLTADIVSAGVNEIRKTDWYKNLNKQQEIDFFKKGLLTYLDDMEKTMRKGSQPTTKANKEFRNKVKDVTGQVDQSKKIQISESKLLKEQFKNLEKGSKLGAKEMKRIKGEFIKEISVQLKTLVNSKSMTATEATRVLSAVNQLNEKNYDKVKALVDKVIDKIEEKGLGRKIKSIKTKVKKGSNSKRNPKNIRVAAKLATAINEKNLSNKGRQEYLDLLTEFDGAFSLSTGKKYEMVKLDAAYEKVDKLTKESEKGRLQGISDLSGLDGAGLTLLEIEGIMMAEDVDEFILNLKDAKKEAARLMLEKQTSYGAIALNDVDVSILSKNHKKTVQVLKSVDLTSLSSTDIRDMIKVIDNIVLNDSFSSSGKLVTKIQAKESAKEISKLFTAAELGVIRNSKLTDLKTMSLIFKTVFRQTKKGAKFNTLSGLLDLSLKLNKHKSEMSKLGKDYENLLNGLYKKNKQIKKPKAVMLRAMVSQLVNGETKEDFDINMSRLEDHMEALEANSSLADDRKLYESQEEVFSTLKGFKSQDEVYNYIKSLKDGTSDIVDFWIEHFESTKEALETNTTEFHGEIFKEVGGRYLPIKLKNSRLANAKFEIKEDKGVPVFRQGMLTNAKASTTTIARTKSMRLPAGKLLDLDFDAAMFNASNKNSMDINTSQAYQKVEEFLNSKELSDMFGKGRKNKQESLKTITNKVREMRALQLGESIARGSDEVMKGVAKIERTIKKIGVVNALGGVLQYPKQYLSVMSGSMVRLGSSSGLLVETMFENKADMKILDLVSISQRGEKQGGTSTYSEKISNEAKFTSSKMANELTTVLGEGLSKFREGSLYSLRKGDVNIAKSTWVAFYKDYLIKNKVDKKSIDMSTEHLKMDESLRKDAISYAELMVEETQIPSDDSRASKFYQNPDVGAAILRSIFMPFQTFSINAKVRMLTNFSIIQDSNNSSSREDKKAAFSDLGAISAEMIVFQTLKYSAMKFLISLGKEGLESLFNLEAPDDDEDDRDLKTSRNIKGWYSSLVKDLNPFAIGSLMEDLSIEGLNFMQYVFDAEGRGDAVDYFEYQKNLEDGALFYRYKGKNESRYGFSVDPLNSGGIYAVPFNQFFDTTDTMYSAFGGDGDRDIYGNKPAYDFDDDQKNFMYVTFIVDLLSSVGVGDADVRRTLGKIKREQQKEAKN